MTVARFDKHSALLLCCLEVLVEQCRMRIFFAIKIPNDMALFNVPILSKANGRPAERMIKIQARVACVAV